MGEARVQADTFLKKQKQVSRMDREYGKWKYTANEKPDSTRHVIVAFDFSDISHYGYYLEPKDKWYTDWTCTNETPEPKAWMEMPKIPKGIRCGECGCG